MIIPLTFRRCFLRYLTFSIGLAIPAFGQTQQDAEATASLSQDPHFQDIRKFADRMLERGRDHYGKVNSPLFPNQLVVDRMTIPGDGETPFWPVAKKDRALGKAPQVSNPHFVMTLLRLLDALKEITGEQKYGQAVTDYVDYVQKTAYIKPRGNKFWAGGAHAGWDLVLDQPTYLWHEIRDVRPIWDRFYKHDPAATTEMIRNLHLHILHPESGSYEFNRHYPVFYPVSLPSSAGTYIYAWAYLYTKTGNEEYWTWIQKLADLYWERRQTKTGLPPTKGEHGDEVPRYTNGGEVMRTYVAQLLYAASILPKDKAAVLRDQAAYYVKQYCKLARIAGGGFAFEFAVDTGEVLNDPVIDIWEDPERMLQLALTLVYAAKELNDPEALQLSREMADAILRDGEKPKVRNNARHVAMAIEVFDRLAVLTGDATYRDRGQQFVDMAWQHFYRDNMFVAKPDGSVYSAFDGSPALALSLLGWEMDKRGLPNLWEDDVILEL